ncbi:hypothetical protein [Pseudovibrio sp. Alg231-02]|uniref:hypothetical protein n=1 Tax=Pseudovibrio sp. Alg231-02 TaxID=1922223 RepID=UPI00131F3E15|nr:hypothetical protein [Pseudovibrio sp. Alg231-02]
MKKLMFGSLVLLSLIAGNTLAQDSNLYHWLIELDGKNQSLVLKQATFLEEGNFKTAFRLREPDEEVVLKTCPNVEGGTGSCKREMQSQIEDYVTLQRDFRDQLVLFYPEDPDHIGPFVCTDDDVASEDKNCAVILESFLDGAWQRLDADFRGLKDVCLWHQGVELEAFQQQLFKDLQEPFDRAGFGGLSTEQNANSLADISSSLLRVKYSLEDLQGAFTEQGFFMSDTGVGQVEENFKTRNCQINWLCAIAKHMFSEARCEFVQQED